jgi:hypothetical protein
VSFESAHQQEAAGAQRAQQFGHQGDDRLGADIGDHKIRGSRSHRIHRPHEAERHAPPRNGYRLEIGVTGDDPGRSQHRGRFAQNPRAGTNIEHGHARPHVLFERFKRKLGGFVKARAECQPGVYGDAEAARGRGVVAPFGDQKEARAHG